MGLVSIVFPSTCVGCGAAAGPLCRECLKRLVPGAPTCPLCTRLSAQTRPCFAHQGCSLTGGVSLAPYTRENRQILHAAKFRRHREVARILGDQLVREVRTLFERPFDAVAAVPSHWTARIARGYILSATLAHTLSKQLKIPLLSLMVTRKTLAQVGLNRTQRLRNPAEKFALKKSTHRVPARILLVDDIRTTGATLSTCARLLRGGGARGVYSATLFYESGAYQEALD